MHSISTLNFFKKRSAKPIKLYNEVLKDVLGGVVVEGCWIVYGPEKNGKTWFALWLAKQLARFTRVNYISAEEGLADSFKEAVFRAGITTADNIVWNEYISVEEIIEKFSKQRSAKIIVIDNLTMYSDELKPIELKKRLLDALPNKLIIFVAHEERKQPYPAIANMAKKMSSVVIHIEGLKAFVTSRFSSGGEIVINEEKADIYWGSAEMETN